MSTTISSYFVEELINWNHTLNFYCNQIDELTEKLSGLLKTSPLTSNAEIHKQLDALQSIAGRFSRLQVEMFGQERLLQPSEGSLLGNAIISDKEVTSQDVLRLNVQAAEKEYIDIKFDCYQFMASLINHH